MQIIRSLDSDSQLLEHFFADLVHYKKLAHHAVLVCVKHVTFICFFWCRYLFFCGLVFLGCFFIHLFYATCYFSFILFFRFFPPFLSIHTHCIYPINTYCIYLSPPPLPPLHKYLLFYCSLRACQSMTRTWVAARLTCSKFASAWISLTSSFWYAQCCV